MHDASDDPCLRPFANPEAHQAVASIIRRHSTNPGDVYEAILGSVDLSFAREILDLGCGFGLFSEKAAERVAPDARFTGVDACAANETPFRRRVEATGRRAAFATMRIASTLPWGDAEFDLVLSSYSLYFFPEALPELARVLAPHGQALVLTHSRRSFRTLLTAAGLDPESSPLTSLVERFPAERAGEMLGELFDTVEQIDYPNTLLFGREHLDEVIASLRFKLPLLPVDPDAERALETMRGSVERWLAAHGGLTVEKDDVGFRCREPRRRTGQRGAR